MGRVVVMLAMLASCGRVGFDPQGAAGGPGDAAADTPSTIAGVTDNFDDGSAASIWFTYGHAAPSTRFSEIGGNLVIDLATNIADVYAGYVTKVPYPFHDQTVVVELVETSQSAFTVCYLTLVTDDAAHSLSLVSGDTTFGATVDGVLMMSAALVTPNWIRFREAAGTTSWETAPDGVTWVPFYSQATPAFADQLEINLGGGTQAALVVSHRCRFDNLNLPP